MKKLLISAGACLLISVCANAQITEKSKSADKSKMGLNHYKDIKTGDPLNLRLDSVTGIVVNKTSGLPVEFFVNTQTGDTVSAQGYIVNNLITQTDGVYKLNDTKVTKRGKQWLDVSTNQELKYDKSWPARPATESADPSKPSEPNKP